MGLETACIGQIHVPWNVFLVHCRRCRQNQSYLRQRHTVVRLIPILYIINRSGRSRSAAAYSHQTFPWTICRSVRPSVCPVHCGTSSSAMAERPREFGDFKKARVNGGTNNHPLKDSHKCLRCR